MKVKYFDINNPGYSIKCKIFGDDLRALKHVIIFAHGFGGHKDTKAAEHFANAALSKMKNTAILVFDWPCHGKDVRKNLTLEDCDTYLSMVLGYIKDEFKVLDVSIYGTSFGGYLTLKYIHDHGMKTTLESDKESLAFMIKKVALRCPAIAMYDVMYDRVMSAENIENLNKGKAIMAGFDRKVMIDQKFLDSLKNSDIRTYDYIDYADDILIIHGTKDELIPIEVPNKFSEDNVIEFIKIDGADHRFQDLDKMKLAHSYIVDFFK